MKLTLLASGEFAVPTLRSLHGAGRYGITAVVTQPDRSSGRGRRSTPTPVKEWALRLGYPVIEAENVNDPATLELLRAGGAELGMVIAFGQKLGPELLAALPLGCINLHASLLPKYRGAAPYQWAVIHGEERTGVTVFRITSRMDAGPILTQRWTFIKPEETAAELHDRLAQIGPDAMQTALDLFADGTIPAGQPQDETQATRAPKLTKRNGYIDFAQSARVLAQRICGLWSWPGATCVFVPAGSGRRERVTLARARVAEAGGPPTTPLREGEAPAGPHQGEHLILRTTPGREAEGVPTTPSLDSQGAPTTPGVIDARCYVATADGFLELLEIQPESGRLMTWPEFVNGRHVAPCDRFESLAPEPR